MLWADRLDSWIPSSHPGGFTPSEEHRTPMTPAETVTISLPQTHTSCCFNMRGSKRGGSRCSELTSRSREITAGGGFEDV